MAAPAVDVDELRRWIGRTERVSDPLAPWPAAALAATLDRDDPPGAGDPLPAGWHWAYFLEAARAGALGRDGHPRRGGFLPPVPLPRRMWAGGRLGFEADLPLGAPAERVSEIVGVSAREGRTGPLVFVTVRHAISGARGVAVVEEHDIVYREDPRPGEAAPAPKAAPADAAWRREVRPDAVLLFRYSALTFNGHRIHYDRDYATRVEGYPGLVVHGPLMATLLLDLLRRENPGRRPARFEFRALSPVFDTAPFAVCGRPEGDGAALWVSGPSGELAMTARAEFA
jgi:3-methylfumaryl-CoA hydratase